jgi:hypothetical protein
MDSLIDRTLGPYLLAKVGGGGMGRVYRATHQLLDQPRAAKFLTDESTSLVLVGQLA